MTDYYSYCSHNTKTTAWVDPRKPFMNAIRTPSHPQLPPTIADILNSPLPQGWDKAIGSNNEVYFIDHDNKKTSWYDPRLRKYRRLDLIANFSSLVRVQQMLVNL